ncbi:MAG: phage tail sheath C-terminal domain-containing protein, partial [Pseudomonadota bacterium]
RIVAAATDPMLPMTFAVDGVDDTKVNMTAKNAGSLGSLIDVRVNYYADERTPGNMLVTIAEETAGATDPTIDASLTAASGEWWTEVVTPYLDGANVAALDTWLTDRFDALDMRDGMGFAVENATVSAHFAAGLTRNSPHMTVLPHQNSPTPTWEAAASYAGIAAFQTQIDPARQLKTLELPGVLAPHPADLFTPEEMDMLLNKGISSTRVVGGALRLWRCVTTYRESPAGALDPAFLDLTTMTTLAYLRWSEAERIKLRFPRHKLADDGTRFGAGQAIVTPKIMRGELIALYSEWETIGLVEKADFFKERLIVERDQGDPNRLNTLQTPDLINNFRIFAAKIQFRL